MDFRSVLDTALSSRMRSNSSSIHSHTHYLILSRNGSSSHCSCIVIALRRFREEHLVASSVVVVIIEILSRNCSSSFFITYGLQESEPRVLGEHAWGVGHGGSAVPSVVRPASAAGRL